MVLKPTPLPILLGVIILITLTIGVALIGFAIASALIPGSSFKEGRLGLILLLPVMWLWVRFFRWCGLKFV